MIAEYFRIAMVSPTRQASFLRVVMMHLIGVTGITFLVLRDGSLASLGIAAQVMLVLGIVEGAALIGWRLTQLPKSEALQFLLVTPMSPRQIFTDELLVGIARFLLVQLAALPLLGLLVLDGIAEWPDLLLLGAMPAAWGIIAGLGLTAWIYESKRFRRIGQIFGLIGLLVYLVIGLLIGENMNMFNNAVKELLHLPPALGDILDQSQPFVLNSNPFGVEHYWFSGDFVPWLGWERLINLHIVAGAAAVLLALRAGSRLVGHFNELHHSAIDSSRPSQLALIGNRPLTWWAVRRVTQYSGRVNLYLAAGFCLAYAAYIIVPLHNWPQWMGRAAFQLFDLWGGPPMVATAMAVMAAVPAAYQYGLWDSTVQGRCQRLELLLLTDLDGKDYARASFAASWTRGRGYLAVAALLWIACAIAGQITWLDALAAAFGSLLLWGLTFAVGFRAFSTGNQSSGIASLLTMGCPLLLYAAFAAGQPMLEALVPTAVAFLPMKTGITMAWIASVAITATATLWLGYRGLMNCDANLRAWYDANQGMKAAG